MLVRVPTRAEYERKKFEHKAAQNRAFFDREAAASIRTSMPLALNIRAFSLKAVNDERADASLMAAPIRNNFINVTALDCPQHCGVIVAERWL